MVEFTEIQSELSKLEGDRKEEDALHTATLTELRSWKDGDPREKINQECKRHREEVIELSKLLNYWTVYLNAVTVGKP